jgi:hypothetical protein
MKLRQRDRVVEQTAEPTLLALSTIGRERWNLERPDI